MGKIVITGASSAIGQAITQQMACLGQPMLLQCHTNRSKLAQWEGQAEIVEADFTSAAALERFLEQLNDVEILINTAGFMDAQLIPLVSNDSLLKMIHVNILALVKICKTVIPQMCLQRKGVIVHISSVTASKVYRGQAVYAGTKAFMETFSKGIAAEFGKKGIRSNCVAPGAITAGNMNLLTQIAPEEVKQFNAMHAHGNPQDVAKAVAFLCQPDNNYMNGSVIHVDGGQWIGI